MTYLQGPPFSHSYEPDPWTSNSHIILYHMPKVLLGHFKSFPSSLLQKQIEKKQTEAMVLTRELVRKANYWVPAQLC